MASRSNEPYFDLLFRVDAPSDSADGTPDVHSAKAAELRARVYASLGLKAQSAAWARIKLGTNKGDAAIETLIAEFERGTLVVGTAHLTEHVSAKEEKAAEWSILQTRMEDHSFSLWDDYPSCRAGTLPAVHALNLTFVSSAFRATCLQHEMPGIAFLRCKNSGRKWGKPWYAALPDVSLGNPIDHPWFDRDRWVAHVRNAPHKRSSAVSEGQNSFHHYWLRPDVVASEPVVRLLLRMCPIPDSPGSGLYGLNFNMLPRFPRGAATGRDFAYVRWGEDGPNREGKMMRFRLLAVSREAREHLLDARLFKERAFRPVRLVDAQTAGPAIPPMFSPAELSALRAKEAKLDDG